MADADNTWSADHSEHPEKCNCINRSGAVVKETVEYRSATREDMPRKFLDIRLTDYPKSQVSKRACRPASGEDGCGQSPLSRSRDESLAGS